MSIEKITSRILQEARDEAEALKKSVADEAAALVSQATQQAEAIAASTADKAAQDAATLKERRNSVAELEARKMRLAAKQEMIEKSFEKAMEELAAMDDASYESFLLAHLAPYHDGEVLLNEKDKARLGGTLADKLAGSGLTIARDTANIQGGFILRNGSVTINGSLESILETEKKQITAEIAKTLFS